MWIIPNTSKFSAYAAECLESKEELKCQELRLEQSLTWRGKLSSVSTWQRRWKRTWWIKHLFGQILKPSIQDRFETEYTSLLEVIPVKGKAMQDCEKGKSTKDSFGLILNNLSSQLNLFAASLKMSQATCQEHSQLFSEAYEIWVTQLRQDYLVRLKSELHTSGSGSLSLHVPTLEKCGDVWPTPTAQGGAYQTSPNGTRRLQLPKAVTYWPTPVASEAEKAVPSTKQDRLTKRAKSGQLDQGNSNGLGKNQERSQLNPAWVAQLMGLTLKTTFFVCTETVSSHKLPQKLGSH